MTNTYYAIKTIRGNYVSLTFDNEYGTYDLDEAGDTLTIFNMSDILFTSCDEAIRLFDAVHEYETNPDSNTLEYNFCNVDIYGEGSLSTIDLDQIVTITLDINIVEGSL